MRDKAPHAQGRVGAITVRFKAALRRLRPKAGAAVAAMLLAGGCPVLAAEEQASKTALVDVVCTLIEDHARQNGLPADFLARLIWKESRFNPNAVSPKGAEGVAQFMPGTAALRGLKDAFDIQEAIPASAAYLAELKGKYGNLGLAAAAYNAGEGRISRWLSAGAFLPLETENYVLGILGEPAGHFTDRNYPGTVPPLNSKQPFGKACRNLPVSGANAVAIANVPMKPWGVQVAGHFRRDVAIRQWERTRRQHASLLAGHEPVVSRLRSARGRSGVYAVRIGADDRAEAERICSRLKSANASCVVLRNK